MGFRIVFFGTPEFAVPSLAALIDGPDDVVGLICQADRPAGRGQKLRMPPTKVLALSRDVPVEQPTKVRNQAFEDLLRGWRPDVIIVAAYGRILPTNILELPRYGCINVHASLLPKYRGAAPIQWAIARGEAETGITIMQMSEEMDAGDVLLQRATRIGLEETGGELTERLSHLGAEALMDALASLHKGELIRTPQQHAAMTLAPPMKKADGEIDWADNSEKIALACRAFHPWPSAFTHIDGSLLKIHRAHANSDAPSSPPGTIVSIGTTLDVAAGEGTLAIDELQLEGRKRMPASNFAHGGPLRVGARLGKHHR